jgi:hypothetical protein
MMVEEGETQERPLGGWRHSSRDRDGRDDRTGPQSGERKRAASWDVCGFGVVVVRVGVDVEVGERCFDPEWLFRND